MTQTDDEKELVLGNKQLISLFFVIVALCGVFFAMGYMIGRNTSKSAATNLDGNTAPVASRTSAPISEHRSLLARRLRRRLHRRAPHWWPKLQPASSRVETQPAHDTATAPKQAQPGCRSPRFDARCGQSRQDPSRAELSRTAGRQFEARPLPCDGRPVSPERRRGRSQRARLKALGFANAFVQK